jgi:hypothetical protein
MKTHHLPITILLMAIASIASLHAQVPLHDPSLPSVTPEALHQLSNNRIRQKILQQSQARYRDRCVCPYQTHDSRGRSCKGRHEVIRTAPQPVCYPSQVTNDMVADWRRQHP